jgi:hypothetical protein
MDLERELSALSIAWPQTPAFELRAQRRRWPFAVAVALAALVAAFAVPPSRGAILDLFDFGGVTIERVQQLPAAQERPLAADLGPVVTREQAKELLRTKPLLPRVPGTLHAREHVVSMVFSYRGKPVLLSEFGSGEGGFLKKIVGPATNIEQTSHGLWIEGAHLYLFPQAPPRLAGNVLLWQHDGLTLRLESRGLTKDETLTLSLRIR